jgi:hypothetical protein
MSHAVYLEQASDALFRRDYLTAMQWGLRAAAAPESLAPLRCDAYLVLAMTSLHLGAPEDALAYAVGAALLAQHSEDDRQDEQADAILALVLAQYPYLAEEPSLLLH